MSDESQEAYEQMCSDTDTGECYVIGDNGAVAYNGKILFEVDPDDHDATFRRIREHMEEQQYWPNVYSVNDHGNVTLHSADTGEAVYAWV